jgi:mercuric ion transport protein
MNTTTIQPSKRSALLSYFSLFTSVSTLFCCALPSVLVLFGLGASVASMLSFLPWLVTLSHYKRVTFFISGVFVGLGFVNMYYVGPRLRAPQCSPENPMACEDASRASKVLLWISAAIYALGFFVAYVLGPSLAWLDRS